MERARVRLRESESQWEIQREQDRGRYRGRERELDAFPRVHKYIFNSFTQNWGPKFIGHCFLKWEITKNKPNVVDFLDCFFKSRVFG